MAIDKKIPTVFDIARVAGVSRGTVDRVIHKRGRYSPESEIKVREAIKELGYSANLNAARLASRTRRRIAILLPSFKEGEYWDYMNRGLIEAAEADGFGLQLEMFLYEQTDIESFLGKSREILESKPDGVIMNAVFKDEVRALAKTLQEKDIPYAFLDNKVDGLENILYVGIDPYRSGQLGAFLLTINHNPKEIALVRILRDKSQKGDPNKPRRQGFLDYIGENFPDTVVHTAFIDPSRPESITPALEAFYKEHPGISHLIMTNSRIHLTFPFLKKHPGIFTVGFDDLEKNIAALSEGAVDFLVTHHIQDVAKECLYYFGESLTLGKAPEQKNHFVHLDILHRLNLDSYSK